ncbi:MAG: hypothetical protein LH654_11865, partial [Thermoleophilia bacterium]|nr:hypothetical protein [Thermoleophilia bacterium]
MRDGRAEVMGGGPPVEAKPGLRDRSDRRVKIGWTLFALTSSILAVAVTLDLRAGSYDTVVYLIVSAALAAIGLLLHDATTRASSLVDPGGDSSLGGTRRSLFRVR